MHLLIIILLVGLPAAASAWYGDKRNTPHDEEIMQAFACGYLVGRDQIKMSAPHGCDYLKPLAERHGWHW
jgi:hypothetical protein